MHPHDSLNQALAELIEERCTELNRGRTRDHPDKVWAKKVGVSKSAWGGYKNGTSFPRGPFFEQLAQCFFALPADALAHELLGRAHAHTRSLVHADEVAEEDSFQTGWSKALDDLGNTPAGRAFDSDPPLARLSMEAAYVQMKMVRAIVERHIVKTPGTPETPDSG